jgi:hypothetical protein
MPSNLDVAIQLPDAESKVTSAFNLTHGTICRSQMRKPVAYTYTMCSITPDWLKDSRAHTQPKLTGASNHGHGAAGLHA